VKRLGPLYLASTAEYARFSNVTDRFVDWVVDERAQGKFASDSYSARLEAGWKRAFGAYQVTPFAGLQASRLIVQGFTEDSVGILGLTFASRAVTSLTSSLGVQLDARLPLPNGQTLTPFARVAWVHEFDPSRGVDSSLTLSPAAAFSANGALAASDAAKVTAGLRLDLTNRVALFGYFDGEFADRSQTYTGNAGVKISW
jgi:outer membrane autotransporter protein